METTAQTINLQLVTALHGGGKLADYQAVVISNRIITTLCFIRSKGCEAFGDGMKDGTQYSLVIQGCEEGEFTTPTTIVKFIYHPNNVEVVEVIEGNEYNVPQN